MVVRKNFSQGVPTVKDYCTAEGLSPDTVRRAAKSLVFPVFRRLIRDRKPGPKTSKRKFLDAPFQAMKAVNSLLLAVFGSPLHRLRGSAKLRGLVIGQVLHWRANGIALETLAKSLGITTRTLQRWSRSYQEEGNRLEVPFENRRPKHFPNQAPLEVRSALFKLRKALSDYSVAEFTRIFNRRFQSLLQVFGLESLSEKTVARYLEEPPAEKEGPGKISRRGEYEYPPPLAMAWIDTTYFKVAGTTVHIVGAMEAFSRLGLAADVFVQENTETTIAILSRTLSRVPGLAGCVRDRGKPYLNEKVDEFLAAHGCLPIDAHPYFPIDKAALERWWQTMKTWLRSAFKPFEEMCRREGHKPTREEVVEIVRPALLVFVRAYNLLDQPYLEGKCPIERLEACVKDAGTSLETLDHLKQLASERESIDEVLIEIRDVLQVDMNLSKLRREFAGISKEALVVAIHACPQCRAGERDARIYAPLYYLRAVARIKERVLQESRGRVRREEKDRRERLRQEEHSQRDMNKEQDDRAQNPEEFVKHDLEEWVRWEGNGFMPLEKSAHNTLAETMNMLKNKFGNAFPAMIQGFKNHLVSLVEKIKPEAKARLGRIQEKFMAIASGLTMDHQKKNLANNVEDGASSHLPNDRVRQALDAIFRPQDRTTDVSP